MTKGGGVADGKSESKFNIRDAIELLFLPLLTAGIYVIWDLHKQVSILNTQVAVLIAHGNLFEERARERERRIDKLEEQFQYRRR